LLARPLPRRCCPTCQVPRHLFRRLAARPWTRLWMLLVLLLALLLGPSLGRLLARDQPCRSQALQQSLWLKRRQLGPRG